jgi:polyhydroxybutyrate depolymerase
VTNPARTIRRIDQHAESPPGAFVKTWETEFQGQVRRFLVSRPQRIPDHPLPVILEVHGSGLGAATQLATSGAAVRARDSAVVIVPQAAIPFRLRPDLPAGWAWNVPGSPLPGEPGVRPDLPDDVGFLAALLNIAAARSPAPLGGLHLLGFSGGARLCGRLALELGEAVTSVAAIAGLRSPARQPASGLRVLAVHGRRDSINPYIGGENPRWREPVYDAAHSWALALGCAPVAATMRPSPALEIHSWAAGQQERVRLVTLHRAGHCWPGSRNTDHADQFGPCDDIDATGLALDFFGIQSAEPGLASAR